MIPSRASAKGTLASLSSDSIPTFYPKTFPTLEPAKSISSIPLTTVPPTVSTNNAPPAAPSHHPLSPPPQNGPLHHPPANLPTPSNPLPRRRLRSPEPRPPRPLLASARRVLCLPGQTPDRRQHQRQRCGGEDVWGGGEGVGEGVC